MPHMVRLLRVARDRADLAELAVAVGAHVVADAGVFGTAMSAPAAGYGVVYHIEIALLFAALAVIGPLADAPHEQLGTWTFDGKSKDSITPLTAIQDLIGEENVIFAPGLTYSRDKNREGFVVPEAKDV